VRILINNRQQGGRRRGRGGQRGQNTGGGQPGNRTDNRQRGNAAQLLEKYKNMARDSQLAGDRVQTEYYLQYADHYYRVLGESRSRFEDQRRPRDDEMDDEDGDEEMMDAAEEQGARGDDRGERAERAERSDRGDRGDRPQRRPRERRPRDPDEQSADDGNGDDYDRPAHMNGNGETIAFDVLPPAIGREAVDVDGDAGEADAEPRRPRRRARAPRVAEGDGDAAPAA
jgi:hypothetical protein